MHLPAWLLTVGPVLAFVCGYLFKYLGSGLDALWASKRDQAARDAEYQRALRERRETFELDSLTRLGEALRALSESASDLHRERTREPVDGMDNPTAITAASATPYLQADDSARVAIELVLDDDLREQVRDAVDSLIDTCARVEPASTEQSEDEYMAAHREMVAARRAVSHRLREIYLAQDAEIEPRDRC
ncbi:MAG TPA: hypothetical protein VF053_06350 [Streptosporangiales bacterium]